MATGDIVAHAHAFGGCFEGASILQGHHDPLADLHVILLLTPDGHLALLQSAGYKTLKVPKREIFLTELSILSGSIWIGNLRPGPKKHFCKVLG